MKKGLYFFPEKYYDDVENDEENSSMAKCIRENRPPGNFRRR